MCVTLQWPDVETLLKCHKTFLHLEEETPYRVWPLSGQKPHRHAVQCGFLMVNGRTVLHAPCAAINEQTLNAAQFCR